MPEIWRYDGQLAYFYQLAGSDYQEIRNSRAFPLLTTADLSHFIEQSKTEGQTAALAAFREAVRERQKAKGKRQK